MRSARGRSALLAASLLVLAGCGAIPEPRVLSDVAAVRTSPSVTEARKLAPTAVARADALADEARRVLDADATGADAAAQHLGEEALAAYELARATARTVAAERRREAAQAKRDELAKEMVVVEDELSRQTAGVATLERDLAVLTDLELPRPSGPASAEREAARRVAARSLAVDARLFCASAGLLGAEPATLGPAAAEVTAIEESLTAGGGAVPIDRAARVRARCLEELTRVRRRAVPTAPEARAAISADGLLAELSAAGLEPSRDERGVVVVVHDAFTGEALAKASSTRLAALDRVAAAHPAFPVLVVVHDAKPGKDEDAKRGQARAAAAAAALPAAKEHIRAEHVGAAAPLVDPRGSRSSRNARLEVVYVAPSSL